MAIVAQGRAAESRLVIDRPFLQFVEAMVEALDARDSYTAGHSIRVAEYSYTIARAIGLTESDAETIRIAGQLHDIGKIGMPDSILQKRGPLSAEEYAFMKLHPQMGKRILERVSGFERYLDVVELHHENVDGTGYPLGLHRAQIPIDARIVRVADAFDAMTSDRSYRAGMTAGEATEQIRLYAGRQFDKDVVEVFLDLDLSDVAPLVGESGSLSGLMKLHNAVTAVELAGIAR